MTNTIQLKITGYKETHDKIQQVVRDMHGEPLLNATRQAVLLCVASAKMKAPVDTGRLRADITGEVRAGGLLGKDIQGVIGNQVFYAPYVHEGTRPHFPPLSALEVWATRHGTSARVVALAIARRGTKARPYLTDAIVENEQKIVQIFENAVNQVVNK